MAHYKNHSIEVQDAADGSAIIIGSLIDASAPIEQETISDATAGTFYPEHISVVSQKPSFRYSTFDLPKVIGKFGMIGKDITKDTGKIGVALYQALYNNATVAAGSNHRRLVFSESYNYINRISVSHRQDARAECVSLAVYDGTNNPVIIGASVALPTLPASPGRWTIGKIVVDEVEILCKTQVDIEFGINVEQFGCDSDVWDTHLDVADIQPRIVITSLDPANFKDSSGVPLAGLAGAHADTTIYLRKRTPTGLGTFVDDATAEHIKITAAGTLQVSEAHNASGNGKATMQMILPLRFDGTNAPMVFDTASAIT